MATRVGWGCPTDVWLIHKYKFTGRGGVQLRVATIKAV